MPESVWYTALYLDHPGGSESGWENYSENK
jgi:hypothetical protein